MALKGVVNLNLKKKKWVGRKIMFLPQGNKELCENRSQGPCTNAGGGKENGRMTLGGQSESAPPPVVVSRAQNGA